MKPIVAAAVVADVARAADGKLSIEGIFDTLLAQTFPCPLRGVIAVQHPQDVGDAPQGQHDDHPDRRDPSGDVASQPVTHRSAPTTR